jgi:mRNA interferase MazF
LKIRVKRGEIYLADLNPVVGSEQGRIRPVLIVQNDIGNIYSPTTVILPLTSRIHKKESLSTHVILEDVVGLNKPSVSMAEQIRTIDKKRLREYLGYVPKIIMDTTIRESIEAELGIRDISGT